jgi:hypothetical protein
MPNPTAAAVRKHPMAVIMLITEKAKPNVIANHDFEWFETDEGLQDFIPRLDQWARDDFNEVGDLYHSYVTIKDTSVTPLVVTDDMIVTIGETDWSKQMIERIKQNPEGVLFVKPVTSKKATPARKPVVKAQKVAKGRKPNAAAAVAKGDAPKPKAAQAKVNAAKKAPAKAQPPRPGEVKPKQATKKANKEVLRQRIIDRAAAKKEAAKPSDDKALVNAFIAVG